MLKRGEVVKLVRVVAETREIEIGCDDCFERLDSCGDGAIRAGGECCDAAS